MNKGITRRNLLKVSLAGAASVAVPNFSGCTARPKNDLPYIDYTKELVLLHCNLVDVINGTLIENATLRIADGKILAVQENAVVNTTYAEVIDINHAYVIPGLIDGHCHTTSAPVFNTSIFEVPKLLHEQKQHFINAIASGVTTVRDMGAFVPILHGFIKDIEKGALIGPRVIFCNSIMNIKGGHPDINPSDVSIFVKPISAFIGMIPANFKDMDDLKETLVKNAEEASFIKLTVDNKSIFCRQGNIPVYSDDHLSEIFAYADKKGLPVACHHHRKWGFDRMLKYPVHSLEHIVSDAYIPDKQIIEMADKNIVIVPTMAVGQSFLIDEAYDELPVEFQTDYIMNEINVRHDYIENEGRRHFNPQLHEKNMEMLKLYKTIGKENLWKNKIFLINPDLYFGMMKYGSVNLKNMKDAGVLIGCGIDAGMPFTYFGGLYREFEIYSRLGFTNHEILQCATINNARILGLSDKIGSIEGGKLADLVVLGENPLDKIKALRKPLVVFKEGVLMHSLIPL